MPFGRVLVLADDLIWATRLVAQVRATGAEATHVRDSRAFERALSDGAGSAAIVDLTARGYDGIEAIELATKAGLRVLAVGQHDDLTRRTRALAAGADRVYAYRKLFEDGPATLAGWLGSAPARSMG